MSKIDDRKSQALSGLVIRPHRFGEKWTLGELDQIRQLYAAGFRAKEIARLFQCGHSAIVTQISLSRSSKHKALLIPRRRDALSNKGDYRVKLEREIRNNMVSVFPAITEPPEFGPATIIEYVARKHGVSVYAMLNGGQSRTFTRARQEAMHELKLLGLSSPAIAKALQLKDHTTVLYGLKSHKIRMYAKKRVEKQMQTTIFAQAIPTQDVM